MSLRILDNFYSNAISDNLKNIEMKKISQSDLANELNLLGINIHKNNISLIESNKKSVRDFELLEIIKVLDLDFESLLNDIENRLQFFAFIKNEEVLLGLLISIIPLYFLSKNSINFCKTILLFYFL